jgi:hypothetical protein
MSCTAAGATWTTANGATVDVWVVVGFIVMGGAQTRPKAMAGLLIAVGLSVAAEAFDDSAQGSSLKSRLTFSVTLLPPGSAAREKVMVFVSEGNPGSPAVPVTDPLIADPGWALL